MLIDTHCHLNFKAFYPDLHDVVRRAIKAGVEKIIIPGTDLASSLRAIDIANRFPKNCYAAIGIHPHHAQDPDILPNTNLIHQLTRLITNTKVIAVGEIGLDYHEYQKTKYVKNKITDEIKIKQKQLFNIQLKLAVIHNLPVIFHCRQAWPDMIQAVSHFTNNPTANRQFTIKPDGNTPTQDESDLWKTNSRNGLAMHKHIKPYQIRGVFHCFSGSNQHLQLLTTMGYYVGFDGNITYNDDWQQIVASTPPDKLLLETDSPFLTPVPYRNTRCEPAYLSLVARTVAKYRLTSVSRVIAESSNNAEKLFFSPTSNSLP